MSRLAPGTLVAGIFAVLLGLAGAYTARQVLQEPEQQEEEEPETYSVPIASMDLESGRVVKNGDIINQQLTREQRNNRDLPEMFMTTPSQIIGRTLREPLKKGETFEPDIFYPEGTGPTVAEKLKPGQRAVTIAVGETGLVAGFARPSTTVDVLFRSENLEEYPETTFTIFEGLSVLAVNEASYPGSDVDNDQRSSQEKTEVTLAVTPRQANVLKVLEGRGQISLALRSPEEKTVAELEAAYEEAAQKLEQMQIEADALAQIQKLSKDGDVEFTKEDRLAELKKKIAEQQPKVVELRQKVQTALKERATEKQTLAKVLDLPEKQAPAPLQQMEVYMGARRDTLVFDQSGRRATGSIAQDRRPQQTRTARSPSGDAANNPQGSRQVPAPQNGQNQQPDAQPAGTQQQPAGGSQPDQDQTDQQNAPKTSSLQPRTRRSAPRRTDLAAQSSGRPVRRGPAKNPVTRSADRLQAGASPKSRASANRSDEESARAVSTHLKDIFESVDQRLAELEARQKALQRQEKALAAEKKAVRQQQSAGFPSEPAKAERPVREERSSAKEEGGDTDQADRQKEKEADTASTKADVSQTEDSGIELYFGTQQGRQAAEETSSQDDVSEGDVTQQPVQQEASAGKSAAKAARFGPNLARSDSRLELYWGIDRHPNRVEEPGKAAETPQ